MAERYSQLKKHKEQDLFQPITIADYFFIKSKLFSDTNLASSSLFGFHISLTFKKDDSSYKVSVSRKQSASLKLEKDGEDISSHTTTNTYKTLQNIIGLDFKTFSQLVYQNTNASLQFLTATDTNRKKFLIYLLHLDEYVILFEVFKEASRES